MPRARHHTAVFARGEWQSALCQWRSTNVGNGSNRGCASRNYESPGLTNNNSCSVVRGGRHVLIWSPRQPPDQTLKLESATTLRKHLAHIHVFVDDPRAESWTRPCCRCEYHHHLPRPSACTRVFLGDDGSPSTPIRSHAAKTVSQEVSRWV